MNVFDEAEILFGQAGLPGTGLTSGEKTTINSRLTSLEGSIGAIPDSIGDMTDVSLTGNATGKLLQWDGSKYVPVDPTITVPFLIPVGIGYTSGSISPGQLPDIRLNFSCSVTGWSVVNAPSGSVQFAVWKNGSQIQGSNPPKVTSGVVATGSVTGWSSTTFASGDILGLSLASVTTSTSATVHLHMSRTLTLGS